MAKELSLENFIEAEIIPELNGISFEKGLKILEELVQGVESGNLPLEKSIKAYERGAALMNHLKGLLEGAEQKIKILQQPSKASGN